MVSPRVLWTWYDSAEYDSGTASRLSKILVTITKKRRAEEWTTKRGQRREAGKRNGRVVYSSSSFPGTEHSLILR